MLMIAQREEGRLKQEVRKLEKELEELKEKKNVFEVFLKLIIYIGMKLSLLPLILQIYVILVPFHFGNIFFST